MGILALGDGAVGAAPSGCRARLRGLPAVARRRADQRREQLWATIIYSTCFLRYRKLRRSSVCGRGLVYERGVLEHSSNTPKLGASPILVFIAVLPGHLLYTSSRASRRCCAQASCGEHSVLYRFLLPRLVPAVREWQRRLRRRRPVARQRFFGPLRRAPDGTQGGRGGGVQD